MVLDSSSSKGGGDGGIDGQGAVKEDAAGPGLRGSRTEGTSRGSRSAEIMSSGEEGGEEGGEAGERMQRRNGNGDQDASNHERVEVSGTIEPGSVTVEDSGFIGTIGITKSVRGEWQQTLQFEDPTFKALARSRWKYPRWKDKSSAGEVEMVDDDDDDAHVHDVESTTGHVQGGLEMLHEENLHGQGCEVKRVDEDPAQAGDEIEDDQSQEDAPWKAYKSAVWIALAVVVFSLVAALAVSLTNREKSTTETKVSSELLASKRDGTPQLSACVCSKNGPGEGAYVCAENNDMDLQLARSASLVLCVFPTDNTQFEGYQMLGTGLESLTIRHTRGNYAYSHTLVDRNTTFDSVMLSTGGSIRIHENGTLLALSVLRPVVEIIPFTDGFSGSLDITGAVSLHKSGGRNGSRFSEVDDGAVRAPSLSRENQNQVPQQKAREPTRSLSVNEIASNKTAHFQLVIQLIQSTEQLWDVHVKATSSPTVSKCDFI